jgi:methionyl-tRNA formyltransferase
MRVLVIAPTNFQAYAAAVIVRLLQHSDIELVGVLVYKFSLSRVKNEFKRDGLRLFYKIFNKAILNESKSLKYDFETPKRVLVNSRLKSNLKLICELNNIYFKTVASFNNSALIEELVALKIDVGVFCGGGILREKFLKSFSIGVLNCHMGVLPRYRGMDVVEWPILENDFKHVGITCHLMDNGLDTGDIIEIVKVDAKKFKSINELRAYLSGVMLRLMIKSILTISKGDFKRHIQLHSEGKQYFVMHPLLKEIALKGLNK